MALFIGGLVAVIVFYLVILIIGLFAARKAGIGIKNLNADQIMLAGRNIGLFVGIFTMTATWVGGGFINGSAESVAKDGLVWCQAPLGYGISLLFGGFFFAVKMRTRQYRTMLDPYERKYGRFMSIPLFLPALIGEIFWSAAVLFALGGSLAVILDFDVNLSVIISAAVCLLYTLAGGLYSVAYTDVVQLILMFIGLWLSIPFAMTNSAVPSITTNSSTVWVKELTTADIGTFVDSALLLILGGIPWQVYFQRVLAARTPRIAQGLSYIAAVGCVVMAIPAVLIGAIGAEADWNQTDYKDNVEDNYALILPLVLRYLCPAWVGVIGLGAVSAAVMSSADSSMLSASSMFAQNIFAPIFTSVALRKPSGTAVVWVMRFMQLIHAVLACVLAIYVSSVYQLFFLCSDLVYVMLFPQLACAIFLTDSNTYGSLAGFVTGLVFRILGGEPSLGLPAVIKYPWFKDGSQLFPFKTLAMLICFFTIICVSYITKFMFQCGCLPLSFDILGCFEPKQQPHKAENVAESLYSNPAFQDDTEENVTEPMSHYVPEPNQNGLNSRNVHVTKIEVKKI